ncbi:gamma-tubulin-complex subunit SPC97 SCDLUD_004757 [Saccharomycodes ludwigii]|uniref:gamma-tubulin-complex subunit SPC97 n=1 Tax=Saccharomycodes ludwigii TaxID=36035 RepID=UPI001E86A124|nr:hypothetical protein SCDLUD_004757 [Saccharomycodes ludwigii]KAH3899318.1 hypothetical protein SCDLUD_004757 [Saccharomycodes ludwigii]
MNNSSFVDCVYLLPDITDYESSEHNNTNYDPVNKTNAQQKKLLLSRTVNYGPTTQENLKCSSIPLTEIKNFHIQESLILRDILHILLGQEGIYIRYSKHTSIDYTNRSITNNTDISDIHVPEYKIAKHMDPTLKHYAKLFVKCAKMYNFIENFSMIVIGTCSSLPGENIKYGKILQRLCFIMRNFLIKKYMKFIIEDVEYKFNNSIGYSIRNLQQDLEVSGNLTILRKLYEIVTKIIQEYNIRKEIDRNEMEFNEFINDMKSDNDTSVLNGKDGNNADIFSQMNTFPFDTKINEVPKGGCILKIVKSVLLLTPGTGNSVGSNSTGILSDSSFSFFNELYAELTSIYLEMLNLWCTKGILKDPFDEFLISDNSPDLVLNNERLWDTKYNIRKDGLLDIFCGSITQNNSGSTATNSRSILLYKILLCGKLLNVYHLIIPEDYSRTEDKDLEFTNRSMPMAGVTEKQGQQCQITGLEDPTLLRVQVDRLYEQANKKILELFFQNYKFEEILNNLLQKNFMFVTTSGISSAGCGDTMCKFFLPEFMNSALVELTRHPSKIILSKLKNKYQDVITSNYRHKSTDTNHGINSANNGSNNANIWPFLKLNLNCDRLTLPEIVDQFSQINNSTISLYNNMGNLEGKGFSFLKDMLLSDSTISGATSTSDKKHTKLKISVHYLQFDIDIPFPLSVVISRPFIVQYQMIQRKLILLYYHGNILDDIWIEINKHPYWRNMGVIDTSNTIYKRQILQVRNWLRKTRFLHHRMISFIRLSQEYCMNDVITREWNNTIGVNLTDIGTVQELTLLLQNYLTTVMINLWLTNSSLINIENKIFEIIYKFCKYITGLRSKLFKILSLMTLGGQQQKTGNDDTDDINMAFLVIKELEETHVKFNNSFNEHLQVYCEGISYYFGSDVFLLNNLQNIVVA